MAEAQPVPRVQQPVYVYPASSAAPASAAPAKEPVTEQPWITTKVLIPLIVAVVANLAIIAVLASRGDPVSTATAHAPGQAPPVPVALPVPANLVTTFGEGTVMVGRDIAPGTYQTTGPSGYLDCYWERLKDTGGATDSIIVNNLGPGPATVTIDKTDLAFQTRWCNTWSKVS